MNSRRSYSIFGPFIYELEEKNSKSEVIFDKNDDTFETKFERQTCFGRATTIFSWK